MKSSRLLTAIALLPLGCVPGGQPLPSARAQLTASAARPRVRLTVPGGTLLPIEIQTAVSTATSHEGDPVLAVLTEDVPLKGFKLDRGAEVRGRVLTAVSAKRVKGRAHLVVGFDAVLKSGERLSISTGTLDSMAASTSSKDKKIIAGAAGTGAILIMKGDEVELPRGARLSVVVTK